jgi:ABC-type multidrug transport system permease subunit
MAPAAVFILALVIYTGFAIPTRGMHPWFRWINWIDPVAYAFEALMINEVYRPNNFIGQPLLIPPVPWYHHRLFKIRSRGS